MWLARHTPENTMPVIEKVLVAVKEEYGDKKYTASLGTYVVGYCFGGKYALRLAATDQIVTCCVAHGLLILFLISRGISGGVTTGINSNALL